MSRRPEGPQGPAGQPRGLLPGDLAGAPSSAPAAARPGPAGSRRPVRRILLVGFMGAGKSTVGRRLAAALGWLFLDPDVEIERRTGRTIHEIFRVQGEAAFRALEAAEVRVALERSTIVIAPGGGWAAQPGALEDLPADSRTVWLRVSAGEAVRRAAADPAVRPLLDAADPVSAARRLLETREPAYARADTTIDVDGRDPDDIVKEILEQFRNWNG